MTTATLSQPGILGGALATPPRRRAALLGFFGTLLTAALLLTATSLAVAMTSSGRIMPRVSVGGIQIGGLDRAAAGERLKASLPSLTSGDATLVVDGSPVTVAYERIGRGYELDAMLDAASAVARDGNPLTESLARLRTLARGTSLPVIVHAYDSAAIDGVVGELSARFAREPVVAGVTVVDGEFKVTPSADGAKLDAAQIRSLLGMAVGTADPADVTIELSTSPVRAVVSTADAETVAAQARAVVAEPLELVVADGDRLSISTKQLLGILAFGKPAGSGYMVQADTTKTAALLEKLADSVSRDARDASFVFGAGGITGVKPGVDGRTLSIGASLEAVQSALTARAEGTPTSSAQLAVSVAPPALTTEAARAAMSKMRRISTWTTFYVPGISNYWGANISIPARDINGKVLAPGEWFDFWKAIGPISTARGYGQGGAIIGGKSVPTGALAGGICSTSTTIFNTALRAGLQMGERRNHYYYISRYPMGLDATVFQTDGYTLTMTFQNDTPDPIVIRSYTGSGFVRFDLWGVPTGRSVTLTRPIVSNVRAARDLVEVSASMKPGTSVRLELPHNGMNVSVTRYVRAADGTLIHTDTFLSNYSPVNGRTIVGPKPASPPRASAAPTGSPAPSSPAP